MELAYSVCAQCFKNDAMLAEKTQSFNPFPNDSTKPTEFVDDNFIVFFFFFSNFGKFVKQVENTVGKGETARHSLQHDPEKKIFENWETQKVLAGNQHVSLSHRSTLLRASLNSGLHLFCHLQML